MTALNVSVWTQSFGLYKEERGLWILKEMNRERLQEKILFMILMIVIKFIILINPKSLIIFSQFLIKSQIFIERK